MEYYSNKGFILLATSVQAVYSKQVTPLYVDDLLLELKRVCHLRQPVIVYLD